MTKILRKRARTKRMLAGKDRQPEEQKRPPAYKRQPDLYYSHVWLDRELYAQILQFIGWERDRNYSIKTAVRVLIGLGLRKYVADQLNAVIRAQETAKREGRAPPLPSRLARDIARAAGKSGLEQVI